MNFGDKKIMDNHTKKFSIGARIKSFRYAIKGIILFFKTQHNAWIHVVATVVSVSLGFYLKLNTTEWCFIVGVISAVIVAEMLNTAIEYLTDLVSPDFHPLAGKVKDVAAGAVFIASVAAVVIGTIIFLPKIMALL